MESKEAIDVDFQRYLLILKRQWKPASSIFVVTVTLSIIATTFMKPSYEGKGKLLFRVPTFQIVGSNILPSNSEGQETGELKSLISTQNPINTQIEVISSPNFLQQIIDELKLKDQKTNKPLEVEDFEKQVTFKIISGTDVLQITYKGKKQEEVAAVVNRIMNLYIENDIRTNRDQTAEIRNSIIKQIPKIEENVNKSEGNLRKFQQQNKIVDLAEEIKSSVDILGNLQKDINTIQSELDQTNSQIKELIDKIGLNAQEAIIVSALSQSPAVQTSLTQIQDIDRQLAIERTRFLDNSPSIIYLQTKKLNLESLLNKQIKQTIGNKTKIPRGLLHIGDFQQSLIKDFIQLQVQSSGLRKKLNSLYNSRSIYERRLKIIPQLEQTQAVLQRKVDVDRTTYQTLLKKLQDLQIAENKNTANARIIAKAIVPKKPLLGMKPIVLLLGIMSGLLFSTASIAFWETRDKSIKTLKEIRDIFPYPLLGIVPLITKKMALRHQHPKGIIPKIIVRDIPDSLTSEIYRMIQANLRFLNSGRGLKTIVVTSAIAKEGKSTVAANFAVAIAQIGRKVLLIDANMRDSYQHILWEFPKILGLSNVLSGEAELNTSVYEVMDNLYVLSAGTKQLNPLSLIDSKKMVSLIKNCAYKYDFVIIDTPALLTTADAFTLTQMTDGILLVVRPDIINPNSANSAQEMLAHSAHKVLGLVVNAVTEKNELNVNLPREKQYNDHSSNHHFIQGKQYYTHESSSYFYRAKEYSSVAMKSRTNTLNK